MAKKKRNTGEDEDKPFKLPKFNVEKFLKRERRNIRVTFWSAVFGILMAFICFGFWVLMGPENTLRWPLVLLVAIVDAIFLRSIFNWRRIDITDFVRKNWFSSYAIYFFTWLVIFIVLVNPPIYDDENPRVQLVVLPENQEFGGTVKIIAKITDNAGVEKSGITLTVNGTVIDPSKYAFENNIFKYVYEDDALNNETTIKFTLKVKDINGRETVLPEKSFTFSNSIINVPAPLYATTPPGPEVGSAIDIKIKVNADVTRVYYTIDDGAPINVTKPEGSEYYVTEPKYKGWSAGKNVTMKVYAEKIYSFDIVSDKQPSQMSEKELLDYQEKIRSNTFNNTIVDTQTYYFRVADESGVGIEEPPTVSTPTIKVVQVPGFEALILVLALVAMVLIFKYRKKDKR